MIKYENDCVDCGFPCMGNNCPYHNVLYYYCDICKDDTDILYEYENQQLCQDCLLKIVPRVEIDQ